MEENSAWSKSIKNDRYRRKRTTLEIERNRSRKEYAESLNKTRVPPRPLGCEEEDELKKAGF